MPYNFENCKNCSSDTARLKYKLSGKASKDANIWVCQACGSHYIDYLDPIEKIDPSVKDQDQNSFKVDKHYNFQGRHAKHLDLVQRFHKINGFRALDIGCGGGMFLSLLKQEGADVCGLELSDPAITQARSSGLTIHKYPIEDEFWRSEYAESFNIISIWDVIEHVNFPLGMLRTVSELLKPDGIVCISTPSRDGFYYRMGVLTYRLSFGRFPTFLNMMYSNHLFGHKQMLSGNELKTLFERTGLELLYQEKEHELSLPYQNYLKKLYLPNYLIVFLLPLVKLFFKVFRIHNKILTIARKPSQSTDR